jgi:hypothetical protein
MKRPKVGLRYYPSVKRNYIISELLFAVPVEKPIVFMLAVNVKYSVLSVETTRNEKVYVD